jgi:hypothetical protein
MRIAHICHQCLTHIACISFQTMWSWSILVLCNKVSVKYIYTFT